MDEITTMAVVVVVDVPGLRDRVGRGKVSAVLIKVVVMMSRPREEGEEVD